MAHRYIKRNLTLAMRGTETTTGCLYTSISIVKNQNKTTLTIRAGKDVEQLDVEHLIPQ
jgi:hypothetical protein